MRKIAIKLIEYYQRVTKNGKKHCRFVPSCSEYSKQCFQKFCFLKAFFLSIGRLLRCNPLSKGGFDPIPLTRKEKNELNLTKYLPKEIENLLKRSF